MTENNAAQPGLTDAALMDLERQVQRDIPRFGPNVHIGVRAGVLRAMLSKLRAEGVQAGDERALTANQRKEFIRRTSYISEADRDTRAGFVDEIARAALASAPTPKDASVVWKHTHRVSGVIDLSMEDLEGNAFNREKWESVPHYSAPQGSAPVAGEPDWANRRTDSLAGWINELGTLSQHQSVKAQWLRNAMRTIRDGLSRYAAPQASEADDKTDFEGWASDKGFCLDCAFFEDGNNYTDEDTRLAFDIWIAARSKVKS